MALLSTKAALKVASMLVPKEAKEGMAKGVIGLLVIVIALPVLFIVALFSSGSYSDDSDNYEKAFDKLGCSSEYIYQLEDIRFFTQYTLPDESMELSVDDLKERMEQDYFQIKINQTNAIYPSTGTVSKKICLLKSDEEIYDTLHSKYNVDENLKTEILESIKQLRNGRANFTKPIIGSIAKNYDSLQSILGIAFQCEKKNTDVLAIAEGTIVDIKTEDGTFITTDDGKDIKKKKGLTVLISHDVIRGINRSGDYDYTIMYSYYTNLSDVSFSVGDSIEQGQLIGKTTGKHSYFEIMDKDKKQVDPNNYIFFSTGKFAMPLDEPFSWTSPIGERDLGYHYGNDYAKEFGAPIYSITDGEVIEVNSTCAPNPASPSTCPTHGSVQWGGNYVVVKAEVEGTTYYIHYAHMKQINASVGQNVYAGQCIGFQGNSGNSYGSHVHIEAHTGGINTAQKDSVFDVNEWLQLSS